MLSKSIHNPKPFKLNNFILSMWIIYKTQTLCTYFFEYLQHNLNYIIKTKTIQHTPWFPISPKISCPKKQYTSQHFTSFFSDQMSSCVRENTTVRYRRLIDVLSTSGVHCPDNADRRLSSSCHPLQQVSTPFSDRVAGLLNNFLSGFLCQHESGFFCTLLIWFGLGIV